MVILIQTTRVEYHNEGKEESVANFVIDIVMFKFETLQIYTHCTLRKW